MKRLCISLLLIPLFILADRPSEGPIRVLYVDHEGAEQTQVGPLHDLMKNLGRDAIWFDYAQDDSRAHEYDVVIQSSEAGSFDEVRERVLKALSPQRRDSYMAFIEKREPEIRESHPMVANYEKRPQPVTFQHPFSVKGSMERTQVPADVELKLFAAEPDIRKPIAMAWDARGRCWVCETSDYPHGLEEDGRGHDSIKICEDTDGDGRADKFTVFADHLNIPTALVFANGGVIVSQPPRFMFLKDTDGDDKADIRQDIITGYGIRDTHAQASNLHYGLDNWIYGCVGYSGFDGEVGGKKLSFTMGTYRFRADGSALEFLHQFTNNAWGHSANAAGDQFGGTANGAPLFYGGIPATIAPAGIRVMTAKKINQVDTVHSITPNFRQVDVFNGYTAAAGCAFIESKALPDRLQGMAMVCEPTMKVISLMNVQADGAGYIAKDAFNLVASSDEWMSPVFAEVGPDGAIWFADFQNFIIQHNPTPSIERGGFKGETGVGGAHKNDLRDHTRGRIYRVVAKGKSAVVKAPALDGDTQWSRLTAQREFVEAGEVDDADLVRRIKAGGIGAVHALWALHGLGRLDEATHRSALLSPDGVLRRNAIRALGRDAGASSMLFGSGVVQDPNLQTRLAAWVKVAEFETSDEIKTLVGQLIADPATAQDEWLLEASRVLSKKHHVQLYQEGPNLLVNAGFEKVGADGLPEGWRRRDYGEKPGNAKAEWASLTGEGNAHDGERAVRCITRDEADTSLYQDVALKPGRTYRLRGWVKTHALKGKVSFNDHIGRHETEKDTAKDSDWNEVEVIFTNPDKTRASINLLHVAKGDGYFDDVSLCELIVPAGTQDKPLIGDRERGEQIFWKHPVAACVTCHSLRGKGSTVGPALDGIAGRKDDAYLIESLVNPNAKLAEGYTATPISPMPPMQLILKPQEYEDVKAFILSLK
ncbi:putative membrane-bound dehydrogenase domain-containing protein [Prosthecobacter debontii]|uniref:Putative membrane-bound dehydrogenase domain-containing protein n=1 Tax=Prosthecobacter debontii TaxID=48467 RepID=A0A1T4YAM1_9BACT|nr:PVC-type heme-binding CxxCH protein [Prosthecobacter debontii]SKA98325.1 putative membrane-bound dehydrogenase domain-containing protein [Prosthecobacter debontii]